MSGRKLDGQIILVRIVVLGRFRIRLAQRERLADSLTIEPLGLPSFLSGCGIKRRVPSDIRGLIGKQLAAILEQAFDVRFDGGEACGLLSLRLQGLATQTLQLHLQRLQALLHGHQTLGEGVDSFGQILGMAADPERHRGAGHRIGLSVEVAA